MKSTELKPQERTKIRRMAGIYHNNCPIKIIESNSHPKIEGKKGYFTTPSGKTIVHHPSSYGWPVKYIKSTQHVIVGKKWLEKNIKY